MPRAQRCLDPALPFGTRLSTVSIEAMQIKCLAQKQIILTPPAMESAYLYC